MISDGSVYLWKCCEGFWGDVDTPPHILPELTDFDTQDHRAVWYAQRYCKVCQR